MDIIEKEKQLASYSGEDKVIPSSEMQELIDTTVKPVCFKSGMNILDEVVGGFEGGELVVISGITGQGKTLLSQTFIRNFDLNGQRSLVFSYEVMPRNFLKIYGNEATEFYLPVMLKDNTLDWIEQRIWEAKLKYDCRIVFIDHLHFLLELRGRANPSFEIGYIVRGLKTIAKKFNIVVFLVAHVTKTKQGDELDIHDIRDSGFIACESDSVLMVWRTASENGAILKVAKNRKEGTIKKIDMYKSDDGFLKEG